MAKLLATSEFIPDQYRAVTSKGKENPAAEGNIMVIMDFADRCGLALQPLMQHSYVIGGKLAFESKLALALLNQSRKTIGPPVYRFDRESKTMYCTCADRETQAEITHGLSWDDVVRAGWSKNSAWQKQPALMMKYRVLIQLVRITWPEVLLGFVSVDEAYDMEQVNSLTVDSAEFLAGRSSFAQAAAQDRLLETAELHGVENMSEADEQDLFAEEEAEQLKGTER